MATILEDLQRLRDCRAARLYLPDEADAVFALSIRHIENLEAWEQEAGRVIFQNGVTYGETCRERNELQARLEAVETTQNSMRIDRDQLIVLINEANQKQEQLVAERDELQRKLNQLITHIQTLGRGWESERRPT